MLSIPAAFAGAGAAKTAKSSLRALRPGMRGTTVTSCAQCGAADHSMLQCPSAPNVV
jgi:hypothetical protein